MNTVKPIQAMSLQQLTTQWDELAETRHSQILSGEDISFEYILRPTLIGFLQTANTEFVVDVGSGTGDLTREIGRISNKVVGVEPSSACVTIAREVCKELRNISFLETSIQLSIKSLGEGVASSVTASMSLMTAPDLPSVAAAVVSLLRPNGSFVATIAHPCFWPRYWGYSDEPWFKYDSELFVEAPFKITNLCAKTVTTHIHRPLEFYLNTFREAGLSLVSMVEPMPEKQIEELYAERWRYPRFLGLCWKKSV